METSFVRFNEWHTEATEKVAMHLCGPPHTNPTHTGSHEWQTMKYMFLTPSLQTPQVS